MHSLLPLLITLFLLGCVQPVWAERIVLFLGDSLAAGQGVEPEEAFPSLLGAMLAGDGVRDVRIINGGISGSTSASGLARLRWYDRIRPTVLFLALGANDGLRGLTTEELGRNLAKVIEAAQQRSISIILAGMQLPPNYGDDYTGRFRQVYRDLAERYRLTFIPFLLEGVGGVAEFNQADGIHPNAEGHRRIARHIYPVLRHHLATLPPTSPDQRHDQPAVPPPR